jgi:hypothetical protein
MNTFDQYLNIFAAGGHDYTDRNAETAIPRKHSLRDWWQVGKEKLAETVQKGDIRFSDTIATPDITPWLPQVIERNVLEAAEPLLVLTQLFERMPYEAGQAIEFPAIGALSAADLAEGENYPLVRLQESGAVVTAKVGKVGVAFEVTEETLNHSRFDVVGLHLRACGRALARHKELKSANMITSVGKVAFDNINPTGSMYGVTTGRSLNGTANGSMILDNLFDTFAMVMLAGFTPNTLIMNPMTFIMFLKDPVLRAVTLAGGNHVWYGGWRGNPAMTGPGSRNGVSGAQNITTGGNAAGDTPSTATEYNQALTSAPVLPARWAWPLRIVVSPFIPYDPATKRTDIIVCDSSELGAYVEEHGVKVDRWNDLANDTTKVKLKERYCFHIFNEGLGVAVMKNVKVVPNEVNFPAQTTHAISGEIQPIPATTPVP